MLDARRDELAQHKKALDQIRHDRYKLKEKSGLVRIPLPCARAPSSEENPPEISRREHAFGVLGTACLPCLPRDLPRVHARRLRGAAAAAHFSRVPP